MYTQVVTILVYYTPGYSGKETDIVYTTITKVGSILGTIRSYPLRCILEWFPWVCCCPSLLPAHNNCSSFVRLVVFIFIFKLTRSLPMPVIASSLRHAYWMQSDGYLLYVFSSYFFGAARSVPGVENIFCKAQLIIRNNKHKKERKREGEGKKHV